MDINDDYKLDFNLTREIGLPETLSEFIVILSS